MFYFFITLLSLLGRRLIGDWSAISRGPVPDRSATSCIKSQRGPHKVGDQSPISRRPVPDQSPTSRRPTAKPSCDSSATSAIVMNFGRGEVAERLQCMSDLGFNGNPTLQTPLDKIQKFNWLKFVSEWILHQFFKFFGKGGGGCVAPWILPKQEKIQLLQYNLLKWGGNSRNPYPAQRGFHDKSEI